MITIIGSGMGEKKLSLMNQPWERYDHVVCDRTFEADIPHPSLYQGGFKDTLDYLDSHLEEEVLFLVSGSPLFYSGARPVVKKLKERAIPYEICNAESSLDYLAIRLCVDTAGVGHFSLHGRDRADLEVLLREKYTFVLCDPLSPAKLYEALSYLDDSDVSVTLGSRLGYTDERIETVAKSELPSLDGEALSPFVLLIERHFTPEQTHTRDSTLASERGMYTKFHKRAVILAWLELSPNQLLFDIGAGSGSVSVDAYKTSRVKTRLFEIVPTRIDCIHRNLKQNHVLDTQVFAGDAKESVFTCGENPDRIFVGGGGESMVAKIPELCGLLAEEGILLLSYVCLNHLSLAINRLNAENIPYETVKVGIGTFTGNLGMGENERDLYLIRVKK